VAVAAGLGYFKIKQLSLHKVSVKGNRHVAECRTERYNNRFVAIVTSALALTVGVLSWLGSNAGWDQLGLNGLGHGDGLAWSLVAEALAWLCFVAILSSFYFFVALGCTEIKRLVLRSEAREEARQERLRRRADSTNS
jgi:heme exporter protein D